MERKVFRDKISTELTSSKTVSDFKMLIGSNQIAAEQIFEVINPAD